MNNVTSPEDHSLAVEIGRLVGSGASLLIRRFTSYWLSVRNGVVIPRYRDFDPVEMPWALPNIFVVERRDGQPFAYRLAGEVMHQRLAPALRCKTAYDIFEPQYAEWTEQRWRRSADERCASYVHTQHDMAEGRRISAERIVLPALDDGGEVNILIGVSRFEAPVFGPGLGVEKPELRTVRWTPVAELAGSENARNSTSLSPGPASA